MFFEAMAFFSLAPLLGFFGDDLGLSTSDAGFLTAAYGAGALVSAVPAGYLALRSGARVTVVLGVLLLAVGSLGLGLATTVAALEAARFVQGAGCALAWTGALTWLVAVVPPSRRAEAFGISLGASLAGALAGPAIAATAARMGTQATFCSIALLGGILAAVVMTTPPAPLIPTRLRSLIRLIRRREVAGGVCFLSFSALLLGALFVLAPLQLDALGWSPRGIAVLLLIGSVITALLMPVLGRWTDQFGAFLLIRVGLVACVLASLALAGASMSLTIAIAVIAAESVFASMWVPGTTLLSVGTEGAGASPALGFILFNLAWAPGFLVGSAASGQLAASSSDRFAYCVLATMSAALLAGVVALNHHAKIRLSAQELG
jgi:predicted MFS family arabinose efflux permease